MLYGWIDEIGEKHDCPNCDHLVWILDNFPETASWHTCSDAYYDVLYKQGWLRMGYIMRNSSQYIAEVYMDFDINTMTKTNLAFCAAYEEIDGDFFDGLISLDTDILVSHPDSSGHWHSGCYMPQTPHQPTEKYTVDYFLSYFKKGYRSLKPSLVRDFR